MNAATRIDSETQIYGIVGRPVRHSLSPTIHNHAFTRMGLNAVYVAFEVPENSLGLAFEGVRALGIRGLNITIPYKEESMDFIDEVPEDLDRCIGAINTIVNQQGKLLGYNTDAPGFLAAIREELAFHAEGKSVLVLGAGGAARATVFALAKAGCDRIWIHNRSQERAAGLAEILSGHFPETEVEAPASLESLGAEKVDLVVNATSLGLGEQDRSPMDLTLLKKSCAVYDLIYKPRETALLRQAKSLGFPSANGLGMLVWQAVFSFERWTGKREGVREAMQEALKK